MNTTTNQSEQPNTRASDVDDEGRRLVMGEMGAEEDASEPSVSASIEDDNNTNPNQGSNATPMSEEERKRLKRVLANRRSARESYQRKKRMFSELETLIDKLSKENQTLNRENVELRRQVTDLRQQIGLVQMPQVPAGQQLLMPQAAAAGTSTAPVGLPPAAATAAGVALPQAASQQHQINQASNPAALQQSMEYDQLLEAILRRRQQF
eukprot:CAMPEP_0116853036 /NCGR_PEP_ID=MMETSP0418-20121206/17660_1 /TAXON_ID=1158023 /ORGANISM="Astrosyne radiata, Strain 13vi08-1A" /LENGTH=208 /DNA_ID=CAMNT_0004485335 /DNA_START=171 /DNA_END=797 /DNA_ORIENTATION=+